ncbi:MAG: hypothetical protein ACYDEC_17425 [Bacteroidia bacterium]
MSSDEIKIKTNKLLHGNYCHEKTVGGVRKEIIVSIDKEQVVINWFVAKVYSEGKHFSSNAHWFNDYLVFTDEPKYFVRYADEDKLLFGEFTQVGIIGLPKWEEEFVRIREA